jgi:TonB-dependent starch-binding outer membrane protein SusC
MYMKKRLKVGKPIFLSSTLKIMLAIQLSMMFVLCNAATVKAESISALQKSKITGTVVSGTDKAPIIGATVVIKGTTIGTTTNIDGQFTLEASQNDVLTVSFVGYKSTDVTVGSQSSITVELNEDVTGLDEVVVLGYGVQKKKLVTGATIQVSGDDIQKKSTVSALSALQSQTPGVNITQSSGMPGEGFKVTIRGMGTVGNSSPLYVIDGVAGGDINALNPADIESVDVLKDAASAAIYGARAANGVILVTTKQGKSGKTQVTYDGYFGIQNPYKEPPLLNAKEYMTILNEINFNEGMDPYDWATMMPGIYSKIQGGWEGTNWLNEIRNPNAPIQNHAINMVGGNDLSKFSMGFSMSDQQGIYGVPVEPNYKRYTVRMNSEHVILRDNGMDIIKFGENLNYNYNQRRGIGIGNIYWNDIHNMMVACPLMPVYDDEGNYFDKLDNAAAGLDKLSPDMANAIARMDYERGRNMSKNHALNMNAYLEIQPVKNLIFKSSFGYRMSAGSYRSYTPEFELSQSALNTMDKVNQNMNTGFNWTWENTISYSTLVNNHSISAVAGQSIEKWGMGESLNVTNGNSLFDDFEHAWIDNTQGLTSGVTKLSGSPWGEGALASFFGRVNYNFKETYMASVVMRADGSSNFARGNRWGYFPSVSAGWVLTNESFMDAASNAINFLKLRASWGQNGNASISNFQYLATVAFDAKNAYSFGNSKTSQSTGGYADILPNKDITWETSEQLNVGLDARFIDSKLGLAFDVYKKTTKDWLVLAPALASYGTGAPFINGGDVENSGIELALNWNDKVGDFTYGVNFNVAYNKNEVTRIDNGEGIIHGESNVLSQGTGEMYRAEVGKPIGYFWGYQTGGVFQNNEQIAATKFFLQENPQPGDLIFLDTDGVDGITPDDKVEIGNPNPDFTAGLSFNVGYKGIDLSVTTYGAFGHQIAKSYRSFADTKVQNYTTDIFARWHGEGTSDRLPRLTSGSNSNWQEISDIYIEDADFMKIQNVTIGYDLKKVMKALPFGQARIYVTAQNLYTFTKYSGQDPEIGYGYDKSWVSGIDLGFYPSPRTYLVGINLKF